MKPKDQQLLEEAYQQILTEHQLRLIEEGKIWDFVKSLGSKGKNALARAQNILISNPKLVNLGIRAAIIIGALAAGNVAKAATYGADAVADLVNEITQAAADGTLTDDALSSVIKGWEQTHRAVADTATAHGTDLAQQAASKGLEHAGEVTDAISEFGKSGDINQLAKQLGDKSAIDDIKNALFSYQRELNITKNPRPIEDLIHDIKSTADYRHINNYQLKQIVSSLLKTNAEMLPKLQGLTNKF